MYQQALEPLGGSLGLSAAVAALPLVTMFALLGGLRWQPHLAGGVALLVAIAVAVLVYGMNFGVTLNTALYGMAFSVLAVLWIPVNAIWIQALMVHSGKFDVLKQSFASVGGGLPVQAIVIAFCFGALLEALSGGGTPVAVAAAMLVTLGLDPLKAAVVALIADTAPVAFGGLAVPIVTLAQVTGLPMEHLGAIVGRQTPVIGLFIPLILVALVAGRDGLRRCWAAALVPGSSFALAQFLCSNYFSVPLADVVAAVASAACLFGFLRVVPTPDDPLPTRLTLGAAVAGDPALRTSRQPAPNPGPARGPHSRGETLLAFAPYGIIIFVFVLAQVGWVQGLLGAGTFRFAWPGLAINDPTGSPVAASLTLNWLSATGTLLLVAGILSAILLRVRPKAAVAAYGQTLAQLRWLFPTVFSVLALAFVMNYSGQTASLGRFLAGSGQAFAFLSPAIGWLGVAITGSDNSANALFGALQVEAARHANLPADLMAAANSAGGVMGKPLSPQSLAIAAAAVGLAKREGDIFRACLPATLALLAGMCLLTMLQATPVLGWMLP